MSKETIALVQTEIMRCGWCTGNELYIEYHDKEWGVPLHDDRQLFEMLILEGAQAGLSWIAILKRREDYRKCFDHFNAKKIAGYTEDKIQALMQNPGIIRNELKIRSVITNAKAFLSTQKEFDSFDNYIWQFTDYKTIVNNYSELREVPATSSESDEMSRDLKKRGFKFAGSTICYAYMQATGMVDDHIELCWKRKQAEHLLLDL
jgi:DNA-3-methyladenine glycosylase I